MSNGNYYFDELKSMYTNYESCINDKDLIYSEINKLSEGFNSFVKLYKPHKGEILIDEKLDVLYFKIYFNTINQYFTEGHVGLFKMANFGFPIKGRIECKEYYIEDYDDLLEFLKDLIRNRSFFEKLSKWLN